MKTQSPRRQRGRGNRFYSKWEERIAAAADLPGEWFINMFAAEFPPPLNIGAMLIAWCADIWKSPSGGQIAQAFRIFEAVTPTLQRWKPLKWRRADLSLPPQHGRACQKCCKSSSGQSDAEAPLLIPIRGLFMLKHGLLRLFISPLKVQNHYLHFWSILVWTDQQQSDVTWIILVVARSFWKRLWLSLPFSGQSGSPGGSADRCSLSRKGWR